VSWDLQEVDSRWSDDSAIAVDEDGLAHISFYAGYDLQYARMVIDSCGAEAGLSR
jgi:hypothetical protein